MYNSLLYPYGDVIVVAYCYRYLNCQVCHAKYNKSFRITLNSYFIMDIRFWIHNLVMVEYIVRSSFPGCQLTSWVHYSTLYYYEVKIALCRDWLPFLQVLL